MTISPPSNTGLKFSLLTALRRATGLFPGRLSDRFLRLVYPPGKRDRDHINLVVDYDKLLLINLDTAYQLEWRIFFFGCYEPHVNKLLKLTVKPGWVVLDVGANIGCHTLTAAALTGPQGRVFAFEPNPEIRRRLGINLGLNRLANVTVVDKALSDRTDRMTLYLPPQGGSNQGQASLHDPGGRTRPVEVEVLPLDQWVDQAGLDRVDLIKMDIEGHEVAALTGARSVLARHRPLVVFEYDPENWSQAGVDYGRAADLFAEAGYSLYIIEPGRLIPIDRRPAKAADLLAAPKGRLIETPA